MRTPIVTDCCGAIRHRVSALLSNPRRPPLPKDILHLKEVCIDCGRAELVRQRKDGTPPEHLLASALRALEPGLAAAAHLIPDIRVCLKNSLESYIGPSPNPLGSDNTSKVSLNKDARSLPPLSRIVDSPETLEALTKVAALQGLDAAAAAKRCRLSDRTVRKIFRGEAVSSRTLNKFAEGLGVKLDDLAGSLRAARNRLAERYYPMVEVIVGQYLRSGQRASIEKDELLAVAGEELIKAIDGWTPDSKIDLKARIARNVKTALNRFIKKQKSAEDLPKMFGKPEEVVPRGKRSRMGLDIDDE